MFNINITISPITLLAVSLFLGYIKFESIAPSRKGWSWQLNFIEFWNCFINFLVTGLVGYYFVAVRWSQLLEGKAVSIGDVFLFIFFLMGLFGHLNVLSLNITEGIKAIMDKYFRG